MELRKFPTGPFGTNCYIVTCPKTAESAIIDPSPDSLKLIEGYLRRENYNPKFILLTHSHWDHFADAAALKEKYQIPLYVHQADAFNLENPGSDQIPMMVSISPVHPDRFVEEGEEISLGDIIFKVIHTPGHSPGGVCYLVEKEETLFSGDTLFRGSIGNLSFPMSNPEDMWKSLKKLGALPPHIKVYPGHGPPTTIGAESWLNQAKHYFGEV